MIMGAGGGFCLLPFAFCLAGSVPTQPQWIVDWLRDYAEGRGDAAAARMGAIADIGQLELDLDRVAGPWRSAIVATPEIRRRALAAFVLDAVNARLDQGARATRLLEWGCRQIRRHSPPDDFDRSWHRAAFALFSGAVDPDGLDAHVAHVKQQFPDEPRLLFERAVASELRAAPFLTGARGGPADVAKHYAEAAARYRQAIAAAGADAAAVRAAQLRLAHVEIELGRPDAALAALDARQGGAERAADADARHLALLFRGLALGRLTRIDEARAAFDAALVLVPQAQSASIANAALLFRHGQRELADRLITQLLERPAPAADPWWLYWPGDYRNAAGYLAEARQAVVPANAAAGRSERSAKAGQSADGFWSATERASPASSTPGANRRRPAVVSIERDRRERQRFGPRGRHVRSPVSRRATSSCWTTACRRRSARSPSRASRWMSPCSSTCPGASKARAFSG